MVRRSNKSIAEILTLSKVPLQDKNDDNYKRLALLERKINLATEGFTRLKFCELALKDRNRLSEENALTIWEYILAMKMEINLRLLQEKHRSVSL